MKFKVRNNGNGSVSRKAQRKAVRKEKKRKRNESWSKSRSHNMVNLYLLLHSILDKRFNTLTYIYIVWFDVV